ncbi:DUF1292 domain-containing protein [Haloplasma contractile]|uniref:Uncharacterized protein n=1 Tax=Haloplasma contractile SSD-17B TaxID=1033810 RepID=U2FLU3_9MOLU|nr:DUF1292 domain-containing protein [Haloplasma contractile]ERJ13715.1 hypothetical protein HLPCO_000381 [Haloplasma contractile SSD-17B]
MDENFITIIDENGDEILCEIIFTFDSDEHKKSYVLYSPVENNDEDDSDDEQVEVLCSAYEQSPEGNVGKLIPIESDEEWDMIEEVFNTFLAEKDNLE